MNISEILLDSISNMVDPKKVIIELKKINFFDLNKNDKDNLIIFLLKIDHMKAVNYLIYVFDNDISLQKNNFNLNDFELFIKDNRLKTVSDLFAKKMISLTKKDLGMADDEFKDEMEFIKILGQEIENNSKSHNFSLIPEAKRKFKQQKLKKARIEKIKKLKKKFN